MLTRNETLAERLLASDASRAALLKELRREIVHHKSDLSQREFFEMYARATAAIAAAEAVLDDAGWQP